MAVLALVLFVIYAAVAFGWRSVLQRRVTGDFGFRGVTGRPGSVEWCGGALFVIAILTAVAAPIADLAGLAPIDALVVGPVQSVGVTLTILGIGATFDAQITMGASWRVGVDEAEHTELVTTGAFGLIRNPIFTAMAVTGLGLVLVIPNIVGMAGLIALVLALQLQVRGVEEPYLARHHADDWVEYSHRVGRFLPGIGTIRHHESFGSREGAL
ncbi:isoprenylcysteine carboxylmethyltransferase family protein [Aeromicrobium sp. YC3-14]|nr:isoprenylcysteine carboxylmethyltransferase family protein [Aeromicrobium stalagmiti]NRQ51754.1 isoprenylcysteine carboxylmethyltransferase family protein [Aeromicrobium stalagmiti]